MTADQFAAPIHRTVPISGLVDTQKMADMLAKRLRCGDVVTLAGDLGAGKTTFAQFLIAALSLEVVEVTSPTFTLLQTYPVQLSDGSVCELYHYDLYRIEHPSALIELGLEEAVSQVALIEWPDRLVGTKIDVALALSFTLGEYGERNVTLTSADSRWSDFLS